MPEPPVETQPVNLSASAAALDLAYRLTVAINVVNHRLESWRWLVDWYEAIRSSLKELILATEPPRMGDERNQLVPKPAIDVYVGMGRDALWLGSHASDYNEAGALREAVTSLDGIQKQIGRAISCSHNYEHGKHDLMISWLLGEQFAVDDLSTFSKYAAVPSQFFSVSPDFHQAKTKHVDLDVYVEFKNSGLWPSLMSLVDIVDDYIVNKSRGIRNEAAFTPGGLVGLLTSVWYPRFYPSVVWVIQDPENKNGNIVYAGRLFTEQGVIRPAKKRELPFLDLLRIMAEDKLAGKAQDECGWIERKAFFGDGVSSSSASHAWDVMAEFATPLGDLEYVKINKKAAEQRLHSGKGRAPARLGSAECRIIWDERKEKRKKTGVSI